MSTCSAHDRKTKEPCTQPAAFGRRVCAAHGAAGGAPKGNTNRLITGRYSAKFTPHAELTILATPHQVTAEQLREVLDVVRVGLAGLDRDLAGRTGVIDSDDWRSMSLAIVAVRVIASRILDGKYQ